MEAVALVPRCFPGWVNALVPLHCCITPAARPLRAGRLPHVGSCAQPGLGTTLQGQGPSPGLLHPLLLRLHRILAEGRIQRAGTRAPGFCHRPWASHIPDPCLSFPSRPVPVQSSSPGGGQATAFPASVPCLVGWGGMLEMRRAETGGNELEMIVFRETEAVPLLSPLSSATLPTRTPGSYRRTSSNPVMLLPWQTSL